MTDFIDLLARHCHEDPPRVTAEVTAALARLDELLEALAPELEVEHYGPGVGLDGAPQAYRLVIRVHEWVPKRPAWSLKVCDATAHGGWRATWTVQGTGRLRKERVLTVLPEFFAGYLHAIERTGKAESGAGRRVAALAGALGAR